MRSEPEGDQAESSVAPSVSGPPRVDKVVRNEELQNESNVSCPDGSAVNVPSSKSATASVQPIFVPFEPVSNEESENSDAEVNVKNDVPNAIQSFPLRDQPAKLRLQLKSLTKTATKLHKRELVGERDAEFFKCQVQLMGAALARVKLSGASQLKSRFGRGPTICTEVKEAEKLLRKLQYFDENGPSKHDAIMKLALSDKHLHDPTGRWDAVHAKPVKDPDSTQILPSEWPAWSPINAPYTTSVLQQSDSDGPLQASGSSPKTGKIEQNITSNPPKPTGWLSKSSNSDSNKGGWFVCSSTSDHCAGGWFSQRNKSERNEWQEWKDRERVEQDERKRRQEEEESAERERRRRREDEECSREQQMEQTRQREEEQRRATEERDREEKEEKRRKEEEQRRAKEERDRAEMEQRRSQRAEQRREEERNRLAFEQRQQFLREIERQREEAQREGERRKQEEIRCRLAAREAEQRRRQEEAERRERAEQEAAREQQEREAAREAERRRAQEEAERRERAEQEAAREQQERQEAVALEQAREIQKRIRESGCRSGFIF